MFNARNIVQNHGGSGESNNCNVRCRDSFLVCLGSRVVDNIVLFCNFKVTLACFVHRMGPMGKIG